MSDTTSSPASLGPSTPQTEQISTDEPPTINTISYLIDNPADVKLVLDVLEPFDGKETIYIDLEGANLGRNGTISTMQIFIPSTDQAFVIDIYILQAAAFKTASSSGKTLQTILESSTFLKGFFDVRNDSDALFTHFGISLAGVEDIQLLELATRAHTKRFLASLKKCVLVEAVADRSWQMMKKEVVRLNNANGNVYNIRPMPVWLIDYCVNDIKVLPKLANIYKARLSKKWINLVAAETELRLQDSRSKSYHPQGVHKTFAPAEWRDMPIENSRSNLAGWRSFFGEEST